MKIIRKPEDLKDFISNNPMVIVNFTASWCGPCQIADPFFDELASKNPQIQFAKINVDEDGGISDSYNIGSMPTFLAFSDGHCLDKYTGSKPAGLVKLVEQLKEKKE